MRFVHRMIIVFVTCIVAGVGSAKPAMPNYSNMENVEGSTGKRAESSSSATVLDRIKQDGQACRTVVVKFLQRPLKVDFLGIGQKMTDGTASHVQVVAVDKATNKIIDNFGLTGRNGEKAEVLVESSSVIASKYSDVSLGEVEMSSECYERAKQATLDQIEGAIYSQFNKYYTNYGTILNDGVSAGSDVGEKLGGVVGTVAGMHQGWALGAGGVGGKLVGGAVGAVGGAIGGGGAAGQVMYQDYKKYIADGRKDYSQHSDNIRRMTLPGFNCQAVPELFIKNAENDPTFKIILGKKYHQPGETLQESSDDKTDDSDSRQFDITSVDIDTSRIEALLNERIAFLKMLLACGERATRTEVASHNSQKRAVLQELANIVKTIEALQMSDEEKMRLAEKELAVANKLTTQITSLEGQAVARKLVSLESSNGVVYDPASCMCANPPLK